MNEYNPYIQSQIEQHDKIMLQIKETSQRIKNSLKDLKDDPANSQTERRIQVKSNKNKKDCSNLIRKIVDEKLKESLQFQKKKIDDEQLNTKRSIK